MTPPLWKKWRGTKEPLDESERREWKSWLKTQHSKKEDHGIQSHHFMANRWGNNGNNQIRSDQISCSVVSDSLEAIIDFIFGVSKITADGDCSHEIKRRLLLRRKAMTIFDSILKSRDIALLTKVCIIKAIAFPIVIYGCGTWTIKKAESRRIDAFELSCWRRLLRVPWTARRANQSILKEINLEYSLNELLLKLKLQYFGHLMQRIDSLEKTLTLGKIESSRRRRQQKMRWLDGITDSMDLSLSWWWTGKPGVLQSMGSQKVGQDWVIEMYWICYHIYLRAALVAQMVKNLPAMQETLVRSWQPTRYLKYKTLLTKLFPCSPHD